MYKEEIACKESRIKILTDKKEFIGIAFDELIKQRIVLEEYIRKNRFFQVSLKPVEVESDAPFIAREMGDAGRIADVGPMAAVAGTIAELLCRKMIEKGAKIAVVENGGDIFAITEKVIRIGLFVSRNKLSGRIAFKLDKENTPIAICSSSSFMGHSLSFGRCDIAIVFSRSGSVADAAVTALANSVKKERDIQNALKKIITLKDVNGAMVIKNKKIGVIGDIPTMIKCKDKRLKEKVTKEEFYRL